MDKPLSKTVQHAISHMEASGELHVYVEVGSRCQHPPKMGSGVIISDLGRLKVSRLTIKRLRAVGTETYYGDHKYGPIYQWRRHIPAGGP
jgi:hypothetical protein